MVVSIDEASLEYQTVKNFIQDSSSVINITNEDSAIDFQKVEDHLKRNNYYPNIYCLYILENESWKLVYIGQRKRIAIRERLRQHLVKKHIRTGSKLSNVTDHLNRKIMIGLKTISVDPDELRQYYENKLIKDFKPSWNIHR